LALAATAGLLGLLSPAKSKGNRKTLLAIGLIILVAFALIAATYAPSALIEKNPPHPRTRVIARTTMLFAMIIISWLAASLIFARKAYSAIKVPTTILLAILCSLYIGRSLILAFELQPVYQQRAAIWDQRDETLRLAALSGEERVEVQAIDGQPIGGLRDFRLAATHWVNVCAARVYRVEEISGLP
jgi:apolipoprotein N-acyltransferase